MRQRQHRLTSFLLVIGAFVVVVSVIVVAVAATRVQPGGMPGLVVASILIAGGALFLALVLRAASLTVNDGGLHLRTLTRTRVIPWSLVRSFHAQPSARGWWFVRVELGTGKKVRLPGLRGTRTRAERIAADLTAVHRKHVAEGSE